VFPKASAPGGGSSSGAWYKTASGERIEDAGGAHFIGVDENGIYRSLGGRLTDVHKNLTAAARMATVGKQDFYLTAMGGYAIPQEHKIGVAVRRMVEQMIGKLGSGGLLPIYMEDGVFNFYLRGHVEADIQSLSGNGSRLEAKAP